MNHEPQASDLQTFRVFSQTSQAGYHPYKPIESVVYCFYKITSNKAHYFSGEIEDFALVGGSWVIRANKNKMAAARNF